MFLRVAPWVVSAVLSNMALARSLHRVGVESHGQFLEEIDPVVVALLSLLLENSPSYSLHRRSPSCPETSKRPSGSQSMENPMFVGARVTTSLLPSRSTATICWAPQWENHNRPSRQRGDSPITRPLIRVCTSGTEESFLWDQTS